jgi:hypothetical protein
MTTTRYVYMRAAILNRSCAESAAIVFEAKETL